MKNPPAMHEMQVQSLSWEDPLEKKMQPTPVFLLGKSHGQRRLVGYIVHGVAQSQTRLSKHSTETNEMSSYFLTMIVLPFTSSF